MQHDLDLDEYLNDWGDYRFEFTFGRLDQRLRLQYLLHPAILRGQDQRIQQAHCPSPVLPFHTLQTVRCKGDGNCGWHSLLNGNRWHLRQPTKYEHSLPDIRCLKAKVVDNIVHHVTAGRASSLADLRHQCSGTGPAPPLKLFMGQRARTAGFYVTDSIDNLKTFADFEATLQPSFLANRVYLSLNVLGAAAAALDATIVVWVRSTEPETLVVHRQYQGDIASVYSHTTSDKTINLYFYNSANEYDTDVTAWAASNSGHFELLIPPRLRRPPDEGVTPRKGDGNRKRGAKKSPIPPSPAKNDTTGANLSTVERQRMSRNKRRAESRRRRYHNENKKKQAGFQKMMDGAAPKITPGKMDGAGPKEMRGPGDKQQPGTTKGGMWAKIDESKAGDPRLPSVKNPYSKPRPGEPPSRRKNPTPCPPRPPDFRVQASHHYDKFTAETKKRGTAVSSVFGTHLKDLPLFQGASSGVAAVEGHRFPWPHEDLHLPGGLDEDGLPAPPEKDYSLLPNNTTAARITKFHNLCKETPGVMCNYCSITLYPEDVKWVPLGTVDGDVPAACRASAANAHVPGIDQYTVRSARVKNDRQEYAFCTSHSTEEGRKEWVFDDVGEVPDVITSLTPAEKRATALLRMRCCMFKGGGGVGSGYTILKGAAEYVPADFDGSVGNIAVDPTKTKDIRPEKVNAAVQWLVQNNPLVAKYMTVWDTHKDQLTQPSQGSQDKAIPSGFPTIPCPAGTTGDSKSDIQGLVLPSGDKPVPETHNRGLGLDKIIAGEVLERDTTSPSPDRRGELKRVFPVYYDPYTGSAIDDGHCMEMLRSVHLFPFGRGGYTRGKHGPQQLPAMEHARYVKMRLTQVDPRFRDPSDSYTFAAVDDKIKHLLHSTNTRSTSYSNIDDAREGFMQRLDEATRAEREREDDAAVARICEQNDMPTHSGKRCTHCSSVGTNTADVVACKRCRHFVHEGDPVCPHCSGPPNKGTRAGEAGKLPMLEGLEKITQSLPSQIPGGSSFWAQKLKELLAMVDSLGRPDIFITKTCHEGSDDMKALLDFYGCKHVEWPKHQVELTRHWRRNIMEWLQRFVKGNDSVFGRVADSWFRFEEQGRGSLHVHLLLWVEKPDETVCDTPESQVDIDDNGDPIPREVNKPKVWALARVPRGSHPFVQRLRQVVLKVNKHARCDPNACGKKCSQEEDLPPHHPHMRCAKGYPFPQKLSRDSPHECDEWCPKKDGGMRCRLVDRHEYSRTCAEDCRVSPFNPWTLAAYPSHENIQAVTKTSFAAYLVKYVAKVEPTGKVSNPLDTVDKSQLPRDGPEQSGLQSVNQKQLPYIWGRKIAMSEATLILSGQSLCLKSRVYMWLDTRLPHLRRVVVARPQQGAERPQQGAARNRQGGVVDGMIEKYCKRPKGTKRAANMPDCVDAEVDFDSIKYDDFWLEWDMVTSDSGRGPPSTLPYYLNQRGTAYWRRSTGTRILGFGCYRPDKQPFEQFYYHHLILSRPFRSLLEFVSDDNSEGTYERQCLIEEVFGDEASSTQHILAAVDRDLRRNKVGDDRRRATTQEVQDFLTMRDLERSRSQPENDFLDDEAPTPATEKQVAEWLGQDLDVQRATAAPPDFGELAPSQAEFAAVVLGSAPDLYYLSGRAGFGKSHVARFLFDAFRSMGQRVAVTGTTATAAGNIGGVTLHRFLQLSKGFESGLEPSNPLWPALKDVTVLIIDEISMATAHLLAAADHVLRRAALPHERRSPFGGRTVIAIGDLCQLPPVPPRLFGVVYNNCAVYVLGLWAKFRMHELRENFRQQDDPDFQMCLDELHDGVVNGVAWDILLSRVVGLNGNDDLDHTTKDSLINSTQATPCISPYKKSSPEQGDMVPQCREINDDHLLALGDEGQEARILHAQAFVKQNGAKLKRDQGRHPIVLEYADLPDTLILHDRLKIVITKNVDQQRGIVNATCGLVRGWQDTKASLEAEVEELDHTHKRPAWVEVELTTGKGKGTNVKLPPFEDKSVWVPFCRGVAVSGAYVVKQWPFMVAACMTIHRVQGVGFERVAVWIPSRGFFAQGQGYTAVSRGKTLDGLFLVLPDDVLDDRDAAREFLKEAFQPPMDAINALSDMRIKAPATVTVGVGERRVAYATLWDDRKVYTMPEDWSGDWPQALGSRVPDGDFVGDYVLADASRSVQDVDGI